MKRTACLVAMISLGVFSLGLGVRSAAGFDDEEFQNQRVKNRIPHPASLEEFTQQVRALKNLGASTAEISEHMSKVINKQLEASNKPWGESLFNPLKEGEKAERDRRWRPLDDLRSGKDVGPGNQISDGQLYAATAPLAWENRVGNCSESASLAYYALKEAGIPARIFTSCAGGGHEFVLIGLPPKADPSDPHTWGDNARVVDGWSGRSYNAEDALNNPHIFGGRTASSNGEPMVTDQTQTYDNPKQHEFWESLGVKGILEVTVKQEGGKDLGGATVTLKAQEEERKTTTVQGIATFVSYPGRAKVEVQPPAGANLSAGSGEAYVETKRKIPLVIVLKIADKNWQPGNWEETAEQSGKKRTVVLSRQGATVLAVTNNKTFTGADEGGVLRLKFPFTDPGQLNVTEGPQLPVEVRQQIVDRKPVNSYEMRVVSPTQMEGTRSDSWFFQWDPPTKKLYTLQLDPPKRVVWKKVP